MRRRNLRERAPLSEAAAVAFQSQLRIAVLLMLSGREANVAEIAVGLDCHKSAARAALIALEEVGLVRVAGRETGRGGERLIYGGVLDDWPELLRAIEQFVGRAS